jgi:hypothetical protein
VVGAIGQGVLLYYELTPSAIRRDDDDSIVIFRVAEVQTVQGWLHDMTNTKIREFSIDSEILESIEFKVPMVCLVTGCVSRRRDAR